MRKETALTLDTGATGEAPARRRTLAPTTPLGLAAGLLVLLAAAPGVWAQTMAEHQFYVDFDSVGNTIQFKDAPLPPVIGVNQNGIVHLKFYAVTFPVLVHALFSYAATFSGPPGATVEAAFVGDTTSRFDAALGYTAVQATAMLSPLFTSGNFFSPDGLTVFDLYLTFPSAGRYDVQLVVIGQSAVDNSLVTATVPCVVSVARIPFHGPSGFGIFSGEWDATAHYPLGAIVITGFLILDPFDPNGG